MTMARASHDVNDVNVVEISGWPGALEVQERTDGGAWVEIVAPKRHEDEYWTFARPQDGVLRCHSDLIGSPLVRDGADETMTVCLPADKVDKIDVRLVWSELQGREGDNMTKDNGFARRFDVGRAVARAAGGALPALVVLGVLAVPLGWVGAACLAVVMAAHCVGSTVQARWEGIRGPVLLSWQLYELPARPGWLAETRVALAGPALSSLVALALVGLHVLTGSYAVLEMALAGFLINLGTLLPERRLAGAWAAKAARWLWISAPTAVIVTAITVHPVVGVCLLILLLDPVRRWWYRRRFESGRAFGIPILPQPPDPASASTGARVALAGVYVMLIAAVTVGAIATSAAVV